jgi:hypothetical protein
MVDREILIMGSQRHEDVFCIVRTNLHAWLHIFCLGAKGPNRGTTLSWVIIVSLYITSTEMTMMQNLKV